jgi:hypothetical protein
MENNPRPLKRLLGKARCSALEELSRHGPLTSPISRILSCGSDDGGTGVLRSASTFAWCSSTRRRWASRDSAAMRARIRPCMGAEAAKAARGRQLGPDPQGSSIRARRVPRPRFRPEAPRRHLDRLPSRSTVIERRPGSRALTPPAGHQLTEAPAAGCMLGQSTTGAQRCDHFFYREQPS